MTAPNPPCSCRAPVPTLFLLNLRFTCSWTFFSRTCLDLVREAEEWDSPVIGTVLPAPLLKKSNQHASLPVQRYCLWCSRDAAETCQAKIVLPHPEPWATHGGLYWSIEPCCHGACWLLSRPWTKISFWVFFDDYLRPSEKPQEPKSARSISILDIPLI